MEQVIGYGEVCRNHGIGNPEDLDSALGDYDLMADQHKQLLQHFMTPLQPKWNKRSQVFICQSCHKRVHQNHNFCHWCGQLLNDGRRSVR